MTKLRHDSPLVRETDVFERGDALVVMLEPRHVSIRLKGHREIHYVDYGSLLDFMRKRDFHRGVQKRA